MIHRIIRHVCLLCLVLMMAACESGGVVLVATPIAPDASFRTYLHPGGAFSIRLPSEWSVRDISRDSNAIQVEFSAPNNRGLPLNLYILNTGANLSAPQLLDYLDRYQAAFHPDHTRYVELSRTAQGDGSWRVVALRDTGIGQRQINAFYQANGAIFSVIEADVTDLTPEALNTLQAVINTLRVNPNTALAAGEVRANSDSADTPGALTFESTYSWITPTGEFVVNGIVVNRSGAPLEAIRVTVLLLDGNQVIVAEQSNVVALELLPADAAAPFSVRFRGGKPSNATQVELRVAARHAEYALATYLGEDAFLRGNEIAKYDADGFLVVSGDLVNQTQKVAQAVKVVIAVFDAQGQVIATDSAFTVNPTLLPGELSRFEVTFPELGGSAIRYTIRVEGKTQ